jgi:FkbM family methyltransferase
MTFTANNFERDLIFDVGASNGDDTAYYLHRGYRVVAVEPHPGSAERLRRRFSEEIRIGRLSLIEAAIAETEGEAQFWLCEMIPVWSSFEREIASYDGLEPRQITVRTCRFSQLLERFGSPFYCKIDIEGSDRLCLEQMSEMTRPQFVSFELPTIGCADPALESRLMMDRLEALGYTRFKLISQVTYRQAGKLLPVVKARLPSAMSVRVTRLDKLLRKYRRDAGWKFGEESSGPFAESTRGKWLDTAEARNRVEIIQRNGDLSDWYDIHAALPLGG